MSEYYYITLSCPFCKHKQEVCYYTGYEEGIEVCEHCEYCNKPFEVMMEFKCVKIKK
jgi:hypothetical protein